MTKRRNTKELVPHLTAKDLAERLRCSPRTIRRMAEDGRLPEPANYGGIKRWLEPQVNAHLERIDRERRA